MTLGLVVSLFLIINGLIKTNAKLEKKLEKFEGTFERDEILEI
jgi:hypothetical protein